MIIKKLLSKYKFGDWGLGIGGLGGGGGPPRPPPEPPTPKHIE